MLPSIGWEAINNKGSPIDYKTGSACSTPTKDTLKSYDRNCMGPVLPPRSTMCGPPAHHYSAPLNFRKGFTFTKFLVDEKAEISAAKSTIADANRAGIPGGGGDGLGLDQSALAPSASGRPKSIAADESSPGGSASGSSSLSAASTAATGKAAGTGGTAGTGTVPDKQTVASLRSVELLHAVADSGDGRVSGGGSGSSSTMVVVKRSRRQAPGDTVTGTDTTASSTDRNGNRADDNDLLHASVGTVELVALPSTPVFNQYGELDEPPEPPTTANLLVETAVNSETVYDGRDGDGLSVDGEDISLPPEDNGTFITNDNDLSPVGAPVESSTEHAIIDARPTTEDEKWANDDPSAAVVYAHVPLDQSEVALVSLEDGLELGRERDKHYYKTIAQVAINAGDDDDGDASKLQEEVRIHTLPPSVVPVQPTAVPVYLINEPNGTSSSREDTPNGAQEELPRLLVNISIATDHGSGTVQHSVYVLQVSIPTPPEHMPRPPVESPESPAPPPANLVVPPPVQCPPEPPPAPPCPIKCPSDSAFARYRVVAVPVEDDSEFVEIDEDGLEGELVDTGMGEPSSTELPEAMAEANDGLTQEFTTAQRLPELTADEEEKEEEHDDDEATTSSSLSSVVASITSAAQCPEVTPPPILILEGEQSSISKQQRFPMISSSHLPARP
uniref:Uncharacterized protein n=1 Tax=Anopheles melas TaxID=34690 RepID=A0A182TV80_9DIPT